MSVRLRPRQEGDVQEAKEEERTLGDGDMGYTLGICSLRPPSRDTGFGGRRADGRTALKLGRAVSKLRVGQLRRQEVRSTKVQYNSCLWLARLVWRFVGYLWLFCYRVFTQRPYSGRSWAVYRCGWKYRTGMLYGVRYQHRP